MIRINAHGAGRNIFGAMERQPEISEVIDADARLQREINHALQSAIDHLWLAGDQGRAVIQILARTLEPSWEAHLLLQLQVIVPIIEARGGSAHLRLAALLRAGHPDLTKRHAVVSDALQRLLNMAPARRQADLGLVEQELCAALKARKAHFLLGAHAAASLSGSLSPAERAFCTLWLVTRPQPRFPLDMLSASSIADRRAPVSPSAGVRRH